MHKHEHTHKVTCLQIFCFMSASNHSFLPTEPISKRATTRSHASNQMGADRGVTDDVGRARREAEGDKEEDP